MKLCKLLFILAAQLITISTVAAPFVYVVTQSTVQAIDASTNMIVATIPGLVFGDCIAITPDDKFAYVTDGGSDTVLVIDLATNTVVNTITSPQFNFTTIGYLAISPDGSTVYVANNASNTVAMINVANNNVTSITLSGSPFAIAITPDGTTAYVTQTFTNTVSAINLATNTVTPINDPQFNTVQGIAITTDGQTAYVANSGNNTVSAINVATNSVVGSPIAVGATPYGLAITPDNTTLYAMSIGGNIVAAIDIATNTVTPIPVGSSPTFMAILPDGLTGYVPNLGSSSVSVIDIATNTVIDTIATNNSPFGIAATNNVPTPSATAAIVIGTIRYNIFLNKTESILQITWNQFSANAISYRIFNSNGEILGTVSAQGPLQFFVYFNSIATIQGITVAAVSPTGTESAHFPVIIY